MIKKKNMIEKTTMALCTAFAVLFALGSVWLSAETVALRSGGTLVGDVRLAGKDRIVIRSRYPAVKTVELDRKEILPSSLYSILERRSDPNDPEARMRLATLANEAGLYGQAVAQFRAVAELEPERSREMEKEVALAEELISGGILDKAKEVLDEGNAPAALMYLHTILEVYPKTKASREARGIMGKAESAAGAAADVAARTVSPAKAPETLEKVEKELKRGDSEFRKVSGHAGASTNDRKYAEKAVRYYEEAWKAAKRLPVAAPDANLGKRIHETRNAAKEKLVNAYLTAGQIHLRRLSIAKAEEYCNKACELKPEDKKNHALHRLILEAQIISQVGGRRH